MSEWVCGAVCMAEVVGIAEKLPLEEAPSDVLMWHAITTGSVLHRIGLQPPPLVMQFVPSNRLVVRPPPKLRDAARCWCLMLIVRDGLSGVGRGAESAVLPAVHPTDHVLAEGELSVLPSQNQAGHAAN